MISELHTLYTSSFELLIFLNKKKGEVFSKCLGFFKIQMGLEKKKNHCSPLVKLLPFWSKKR